MKPSPAYEVAVEVLRAVNTAMGVLIIVSLFLLGLTS